MTVAHAAMETEVILKIDMTIKIREEAVVIQEGISMKTGEEVKIIHIEGDENNGMVMTLITMTGIIGIEIMKVKVLQIEVENGMVTGVKGIVIRERKGDGTTINNISSPDIHCKTLNIPILTTIAHLRWEDNIDTQSHMSSILIILPNPNTHHKDHQHSHVKR